MPDLFAVDYTGEPFHLFGTVHLILLGIVVLINVSWFYFRGKLGPSGKRNVRYAMATMLLLNELGYHAWRIATETWVVEKMLPFHLCSVMVCAGIVMLFTNKHRIYEFLYFLGIGGAMQALLTPDVGIYGFPHYWCLQSFIAHGLLVTAPIYMTIVEGHRPRWKSILRVAIVVNIYMVFVGIVNALVGSNYMFLAHKPDTSSALDLMGPWPWYILGMEGMGLVAFVLLYLPFAIKDWRKAVSEKQVGVLEPAD